MFRVSVRVTIAVEIDAVACYTGTRDMVVRFYVTRECLLLHEQCVGALRKLTQ